MLNFLIAIIIGFAIGYGLAGLLTANDDKRRKK